MTVTDMPIAVGLALGHPEAPLESDDDSPAEEGLWADRFSSGGSVFDLPPGCPAVWGDGQNVLWAEGEGLMIAALQGTGKTTIAQQLVLHGIGVRRGDFVGHPVKEMSKVLYLAMDRPQQAQRSFKRMVEPSDRAALDERLVIWKGPPPASVIQQPELLVIMAQSQDADVLVIDSLKDLAPGLSKDEVGASVNSAFQMVIAAGIELVVLNHNRKPPQDSSKKGTPDIGDVYGSTWLSSGMGSVLMITGKPGDTTVGLNHLKQPAEVVGPLRLKHDHPKGKTTIDEDSADPYTILKAKKSATAQQVAAAWFGTNSPSRTEIQRTRRERDKLADKGHAERFKDDLGVTYQSKRR